MALAERVATTGQVTGIDISTDLLAIARTRLDSRSNVHLIEADAERHPFAPTLFDALFSRFGSLFFDNPDAAFRNLHGALKPGAPAVFLAWREPARNQWASVPLTFVAPAGAPTPVVPGPGPFAWSDPAAFRPILQGAGFKDIQETPFEFMAEIASGDDPDPLVRAVAFMMRIGPLASRLKGADDAQRREAEAFLQRRLARHVHNGAVRLLASAWIIQASA